MPVVPTSNLQAIRHHRRLSSTRPLVCCSTGCCAERPRALGTLMEHEVIKRTRRPASDEWRCHQPLNSGVYNLKRIYICITLVLISAITRQGVGGLKVDGKGRRGVHER